MDTVINPGECHFKINCLTATDGTYTVTMPMAPDADGTVHDDILVFTGSLNECLDFIRELNDH